MKVICAKHQIDLIDSRCRLCIDEYNLAVSERHAGRLSHSEFGKMRKYPRKVFVDGNLTDYSHESTYIEKGGIPYAISEQAEEIINKMVKEYESKCDCYLCIRERNSN